MGSSIGTPTIVGGGVRVGSVTYATEAPSAEYLPADGSILPRAAYLTLADALGDVPAVPLVMTSANIGIANFNVVAYGDGVWVGFAGLVPYTSPDGRVWTARAALASAPTAVGYGDGVWVAAGNGTSAWYSVDGGVTWTVRNLASSITARFVTFLNGLWVVGGSTGTAVNTNPDPRTTAWTSRVVAVGGEIRGAAYGNGRWVIVGSGTPHYSTDGVTWTAGNDRAFQRYYWSGAAYATHALTQQGIVFMRGQFVAVGGNTVVHTSVDGHVWARRSPHERSPEAGQFYGNLVESAGMLFCAGNIGQGAGTMGALFVSPDAGATWHGVKFASGQSADQFRIAAGGGLVVAPSSTVSTHCYADYLGYDPATHFRVPDLLSLAPRGVTAFIRSS